MSRLQLRPQRQRQSRVPRNSSCPTTAKAKLPVMSRYFARQQRWRRAMTMVVVVVPYRQRREPQPRPQTISSYRQVHRTRRRLGMVITRQSHHHHRRHRYHLQNPLPNHMKVTRMLPNLRPIILVSLRHLLSWPDPSHRPTPTTTRAAPTAVPTDPDNTFITHRQTNAIPEINTNSNCKHKVNTHRHRRPDEVAVGR